MKMNSFQRAKIMYDVLKQKKEIGVEDVVFQFEVAISTAYNILKLVEMMCDRTGECETKEISGKKIIIWKGHKEEETSNKEEPIVTAEEDQQLALKKAYVNTKGAKQ